jgi:hypothetical protein
VIKLFIAYIKCKIKGHLFIDGGSCPFTGKSYNSCIRCGVNIPK